MNRKALSVLLAGAVFLGLIGCEKKPAASRAQPPTTRGRQAPGAGTPTQEAPTTVGGQKQAPAPGQTAPGAPSTSTAPGATAQPPAGKMDANQPGATTAPGASAGGSSTQPTGVSQKTKTP